MINELTTDYSSLIEKKQNKLLIKCRQTFIIHHFTLMSNE